MAELVEKLQAISVGTLPRPPMGKVLTIPNNTSVEETLRILQSNKILSAPVVDADVDEGADWKKRYIGIIDVVSLVVFAMEALSTPSVIPEEPEDGEAGDEDSFDISALPTEFASQPISAIADNMDIWIDFMPIMTDATLFDAMAILSTYRMKRVPVIDESTLEVVNFITQTTLIKAIKAEAAQFEEMMAKTLDDLGLGEPKEVYSIRSEAPVKDAFELIKAHKISGVPVVGVDGILLGSISARDIYYVATSPSKMSMLSKTAARFLEMISRHHSWDGSRRGVEAKKEDSLAKIIEEVTREKAHRVYITGDDNCPCRVVSLVDIIAKFVAIPDNECCLL